jgi:quercetin dioxygenase-like cupin family protein
MKILKPSLMDTMTTVSEVLNALKSQGYTVDFNVDDNCLASHSNSLKIHPEEFIVDKHYRFEGMSDPDDEAIVYAISSQKHNIKGTLVDGYGLSSDKKSFELINALKEKSTAAGSVNKLEAIGVKATDATPLRPEGERELDAAMITMDLPRLMIQIKEEQAYKNGDRSAITIFKSTGMRIVLVALHKGTEMKTHTAPGVISVQVLEGEITFSAKEKSVERSAGQMLALHAGIPHSVKANENSIFLLTLSLQTETKL